MKLVWHRRYYNGGFFWITRCGRGDGWLWEIHVWTLEGKTYWSLRQSLVEAGNPDLVFWLYDFTRFRHAKACAQLIEDLECSA